jgi:AraC family transcriptional regulator
MKRTSRDEALTPAGTHELPGAQVFNSLAPHPEGYFWQGKGPLSLKWFPKGQATYEADGGRFLVGARDFLILNHDQPYSVTRPSEAEAESFLIFFERAFASEVLRSLVTPEDRLLDTPHGAADGPPEFFTRVYPLDETVAPRLLRLRAALAGGSRERLRFEEQLCGVLESLLLTHRATRREVERMSAARGATRGELYRRLHRARDYAAATLGHPLTLGEMARVACLSPNHFLRSFKQFFRQTPHQYLTDLRLERAEELLAGTELPITEICFAIGFESLGSFSTLFRRRTGVSPRAYRRDKKVIFKK